MLILGVEEPSSAETKKVTSAAKLAEPALNDPKCAKRADFVPSANVTYTIIVKISRNAAAIDETIADGFSFREPI
ncbi:hypothetical protein BC332_30454 [Capsicum chinense]|nr:hypothetical protein BC332_30454 [Capsicum chinense]